MKIIIAILFVLSSWWNCFASKVDTVFVMSKAMNKKIANVIITPDKAREKKLPVLYLLHGAGGNQKDWITKVPAIKEYADKYNIIIVCPDGGITSWYFDSPIDSSMRYETYITKELISHIDANYKTIGDRNGRAITGLSMGGHGAFYLTFRHTDLFGAAGSLSGGVDFRPFPKNWDLAKRLGEYSQFPENWNNNTVISLVDSIVGKPLKLIFDCGVNDFFYPVNKELHKKLLEKKIPHDYIERPGEHNWAYWDNAIKYQLLFFNDFFSNNN